MSVNVAGGGWINLKLDRNMNFARLAFDQWRIWVTQNLITVFHKQAEEEFVPQISSGSSNWKSSSHWFPIKCIWKGIDFPNSHFGTKIDSVNWV